LNIYFHRKLFTSYHNHVLIRHQNQILINFRVGDVTSVIKYLISQKAI